MNETLVASILAITYGLVEAIKWLIKGSQKRTDKQEQSEHITVILEKLRHMESTLITQSHQMNEIIRILDRVTITEAMMAEVVKETNKMVAKIIKSRKK